MKQKFLSCAVAVALVAVGCSTQDPSNAATPAAADAPVAAVSEAPPVVAEPSPAPVAVAPSAPAMPSVAMTTPSATAAPAAAGSTVETAARINVAEAARLVAAGSAVIVDVRDEASFKASRAKGAIHIPYAQIGQRLSELPMGKTVITYCT